MNSYSAFSVSKETAIPVLVIHDNNDLKFSKSRNSIFMNKKMFINRWFRASQNLGNPKVIEKNDSIHLK
jgi:hypothetical protein